MEVIELISDEESVDENVKKTKSEICNSNCINFKCSSGLNMKLAPSFARAFYGAMTEKKKRRMICKKCFDVALEHQKVCKIRK